MVLVWDYNREKERRESSASQGNDNSEDEKRFYDTRDQTGETYWGKTKTTNANTDTVKKRRA